MRTNRQMESLYRDIRSKDLDDPKRLSKRLNSLIASGFIRANSCVLLAAQGKLAGNATLNDFPDLTGYECFVNHVHVEDYLDEVDAATQLARLGQGLALAYSLKEKLSSYSMNEDFRLIISSDELSCSVRFHVIRSGEEWLSHDLDNYQHEAILVLDT